MAIAIVGLDLAKHVFQVHAVDEAGRAILRRQLRRAGVEAFFKTLPPCVVGMEACASAHHWARRIAALGHKVRLIAPAKVKPYVQRGKKNDANDAAAIVEALMRPHMVFVPVKNEEQQAVLMLHRTRDLLVRQRTMLVNAIRAHILPNSASLLRKGAARSRISSPASTTLKCRSWPASLSGRLLIRSINATNVLMHWNGESWLGISRTKPAAISPRSPASVRLRPRRLPPRSPIPLSSGTAANWQHGWGWSPGKIRAAARTD